MPAPTMTILGFLPCALAACVRLKSAALATAPTPRRNFRRSTNAAARSSRTLTTSTPRREASACSRASRSRALINGERAILHRKLRLRISRDTKKYVARKHCHAFVKSNSTQIAPSFRQIQASRSDKARQSGKSLQQACSVGEKRQRTDRASAGASSISPVSSPVRLWASTGCVDGSKQKKSVSAPGA